MSLSYRPMATAIAGAALSATAALMIESIRAGRVGDRPITGAGIGLETVAALTGVGGAGAPIEPAHATLPDTVTVTIRSTSILNRFIIGLVQRRKYG